MPALALSLLGFGKSAVSAIFGWLSRRSLSEIICLIMACMIVTLSLYARHWKAIATERQGEVVNYRRQLADETAKAKKLEADGKQISQDIRNRNDAENSRIAGDAQSVRVRGPGKSLCRPAPAAPGGPEQAAPEPDAPGPALPPADSAAVPWNWLTDRAVEHDEAVAENKAWHEWYQRLVAAWPKD